MAIKENNTDYNVINDNPVNYSLFNYGRNTRSPFTPPPGNYMVTEITSDIMITESGDFMITEF